MNKRDKLFDQFPPVSNQEWLGKIDQDLKGADFNRKLVWKTYEGFDVMPFYRAEDTENIIFSDALPGEFPYIRGTKKDNNHWRVRQNITVKDYIRANRKAHKILNRGVDSLGFIIFDPESVSEKNIDSLLKNISPEIVEINFHSDGKVKEIAEYFLRFIDKTHADYQKVTGAIEMDPLSRLMLNGTLCIPVDKGFDYLAEAAVMTASLPHFRAIHINASNFGNAGADMVQELAFAISMGAEYLSQLVERGMSIRAAASLIRFSFGTGSSYFPEIAKLRAARLLWSVVMNGFLPGNYESARMEIHCVTTRWNKTIYDPHVNIIRTQTEAMAAVLGGTDSLTVEPFDIVFRDPDLFSERIARNQQLLLKNESCFDRVADPAAGSYYIENLTKMMADKAWILFLETESHGGFLESLRKGFIQQKINESALKLKNDISKRKLNFVGTSIFSVPDEKIPAGTSYDKLFPEHSPGEDNVVDPIRLFRGPALFEKTRMKTK